MQTNEPPVPGLLQRLRCRGHEGGAARSTSRRGEQPSTPGWTT